MNHTYSLIIPALLLPLGCSTPQQPRTVASGASCATLAGSDKTLASFYESGTVYSAEPIREKVFRARAAQPTVTMGAKLKVRAEPGMNAPYLQRVLACHAAGAHSPHPNDPLHPSQGAVADLTVERSQFGFEVAVRGEDRQTGNEVWDRAAAMSNASADVKVEQLAQSDVPIRQF